MTLAQNVCSTSASQDDNSFHDHVILFVNIWFEEKKSQRFWKNDFSITTFKLMRCQRFFLSSFLLNLSITNILKENLDHETLKHNLFVWQISKKSALSQLPNFCALPILRSFNVLKICLCVCLCLCVFCLSCLIL